MPDDKENEQPTSLVAQSTQQLSTRASFVKRGLQDISVQLTADATDWSQPTIVGWFARPTEVLIENFPDSSPDMKCISFRCEVQNISDSLQGLGPDIAVFCRSRTTGKVVRLEYANIVPTPAEDLVKVLSGRFLPIRLAPQEITDVLLWFGRLFPKGKPREECVEELLSDLSEILAHDEECKTTIVLRVVRPIEMDIVHDDLREKLLVTPVSGNQYRLEESAALGEIFYGDVIELRLAADGSGHFQRVVTPSLLTHESFMVSQMMVDSPLFQPLLDRIIAIGGNWERVFGGIFYVHLPKSADLNVRHELELIASSTKSDAG